VRIGDVEALVVSEPPDQIARHSWDGSQDDVVIRVTTECGLVGLGEVDSSPAVIKAIVETPPSMRTMWGLRDLCVGEDPRDIARLWDKMYEATSYYGRWGAAIHAMSGVELALWDILGKATGLPVSVLLGGPVRSSLRAYASVICPDDVGEARDLVAALVETGYSAVKLGGGPLGADLDHDEAILTAVREVAPSVELMLDLGQALRSTSAALAAARRYAPFAVSWLEEPIWPEDLDAYVWLSDRSPIPIAAGEAESSEDRMMTMIARRAVHVLQPDPTRIGGLRVASRILRAAGAAGLTSVLHCWNTGISKAACLQLSAAARDVTLLEHCVEPNVIQARLTRQRFPLVDGHVEVPRGPGLGVDLDPEVLAAHLRDGRPTATGDGQSVTASAS
jgi:L-alanine-DL-glutamate epimerase-like enolase superfamily enzyme